MNKTEEENQKQELFTKFNKAFEDFELDLRKYDTRHETNPFLTTVDTETGEEIEVLAPNFRRKRNVWNTDKTFGIVKERDGGQRTDEGAYAFIEHKTVDEDEFVKVYIKNLGLWDELSRIAQKVFYNILPDYKPNKDEIYLDLRTVQKRCGYKSRQQVYKGIKELVSHEFIAPSTRLGWWWINPLIAFNGNRQYLVTVLDKKPDYRAVKKVANKWERDENGEQL